MNNEHQPVTKAERLSALIDNETDAFASRRLIDELLKSEVDRAQWSRHHLIGDCLRGGMKQLAPRDFLTGIQAGIADAAPLQAPVAQANLPRWLKPVAGLGVAAAVAVVSLAGLQMVGPAGNNPGISTIAEVAPAPAPVTIGVTLAAEEATTDSSLALGPDPRFAPYLENHAELLTPGSSAFARVRNSVAGE